MRVKLPTGSVAKISRLKTRADALRVRLEKNIRRGLICINVLRRADPMIRFLEDGRYG